MPRSGGEADKLGNHFEAVWTVQCALHVIEGKYASITVEALGEESVGVEFHLKHHDQRLQFHSVKRQKTGGDWSISDLCSPTKSTGSVLGDLFEKYKRWPECETRFISSTGANILRELSEKATCTPTYDNFAAMLTSKEQKGGFAKIINLFKSDSIAAFSALKSLEVILYTHRELIRNVEDRIARLFYSTDGSKFDAGNIRRMLSEFFLEHLTNEIDAVSLQSFLRDRRIGIKDWVVDPTIQSLVAMTNDRYLRSVESELINSNHIEREIVNEIIKEVLTSTSRGALVIAPGGHGKSCVLAQCVSSLKKQKITHLCLRMDSISSCETSKELGTRLNLPDSPAFVLAEMANSQPTVLVIDQLDAMSLVSGRKSDLWGVFDEVQRQAKICPNVKVILSCRDFDLEHDHRLRELGNPNSGLKKISVGLLTESEIRATLTKAGLDTLQLTLEQIAILAVPFHLLLFLKGDPSRSFENTGELYERYWERKQQNLQAHLGRAPQWNEVIDAIVARMSRDQLLFAPIAVTGNWARDAQAMASEHVLIENREQRQYRFFHESFFDYAYARRICERGESVIEMLSSSEQHLFRRAQVRQILAFQRENDFSQYLNNVHQIFDLPNIRFHIKKMVATEFNRLRQPNEREWQLIQPYLFQGNLATSLSLAIRDHVGWFDLLDRLNVIQDWLSSDQTEQINLAIWYLEPMRLHDQRSQRIAELLLPYTNGGREWELRIQKILSWGVAHKSDAMAKIFKDMISDGAFDDSPRDTFWSFTYHA